MELGARIKELRRQRNLTQQELADRVNVSTRIIKSWEAGESRPNATHMTALSNELLADLNYLLREDYSDNKMLDMSCFTQEHVDLVYGMVNTFPEVKGLQSPQKKKTKAKAKAKKKK